MHILTVLLPLVLGILVVFYYCVVVGMLTNNEFKTKKEFLLALLPFQMFFLILWDDFKKLK